MNRITRPGAFAAACTAALSLLCMSARAEMSAEDLAKLAHRQSDSVPFQNNTNSNSGPPSGTQNILNIQPVIPIAP